MIPLWMKAIPKQVWIAIGLLVLLAVLTEAVLFYGDTREKLGEAHERASWTRKYDQAVRARDAAALALIQAQHERDAAIAARQAALSSALHQTLESIHNAPNLTAAYAAYTSLADRLRSQSAANRTRAWADYSASVASTPSNGAGMSVSRLDSYLAAEYTGRYPEQLLPVGSSIGPV